MKKLLLVLTGLFLVSPSFAQETGIANNLESPHVQFKSIDIGDCQWTEGFWADKFRLCEETMVPYMGEILKGDIGHAYNNFKLVAGENEGEHGGAPWHDGDFYKWIEAAAYVHAINKAPKILEDLDEIIEVIGEAQADDGYLHTKIMLEGTEPFSNRGHHELYNSGHLLTAACIHHRVTGRTNFLDIAIKHADLLYKTFQPRPTHLAWFAYNPTQITGLVELYRTTRDPRYLELAGIFIDMRGNHSQDGLEATSPRKQGDMVQDRVPFRKETEAVGHAVLAMYLYCGAADVYAETGEEALMEALVRIWSNVVNHKMYVTGGVGQGHHGSSSRADLVHEAFLTEYTMPNATAYNETCANVCHAMFNWRMLGITGESKYADIMELVLYNSALSGISADGKHYFYANPLRRTFDQKLDNTSHPTRQPYLQCFCCPPNIVRTIAKVAGWAYSLTDNGVAVSLYGGNQLDTQMLDGSKLKLRQVSQYPWDGAVRITIEECKGEAFDIKLRIPRWAEGTKVMVNGEAPDVDVAVGRFATITRQWKAGDIVSLEIPMETVLLAGHPRIEEVRNQVAIKRGPVIYCLESPDLPEDTSVLDVYLPPDIELAAKHEPDFLGGLTTLSGSALVDPSKKANGMYHEFTKPKLHPVQTRFIPYYAWSNRGVSEMSVWLPLAWEP